MVYQVSQRLKNYDFQYLVVDRNDDHVSDDDDDEA